MDIQTLVQTCAEHDVVVTVLPGDKLSVRGATDLPIAQMLIDAARQDKGAVMEAVKRHQSEVDKWKSRLSKINGGSDISAPDPAPRRADDLDARTADLKLFVGRVVSNDQMYILMRRSNRGPVKVWGEWYNSATWPCDHLIMGWWETG